MNGGTDDCIGGCGDVVDNDYVAVFATAAAPAAAAAALAVVGDEHD